MAGVETAQAAPQSVDFRTRLGRRIGDALHLPPPNIPLRRKIAASVLENTVWPHEEVQIHNDAIQRAEHLMKEEGYGLVVGINHWSSRDPEEVIKDLMLMSDYFRTREMVAPVGHHQWKKYLPPLGRFFGIDTYRVVTPHTRDLQADVKSPSFTDKAKAVFSYQITSRLPRNERMSREEYERKMRGERLSLEEREQGGKEYLSATADALEAGNIVLLAPEAERGPKLREFRGGPLQMIVNEAKKRGFTKIAFLMIGVGEKGRKTYKKSGLRLFKKATVEVASCITLQEAQEEVRIQDTALDEHNASIPPEQQTKFRISLDNILHQVMEGVVPERFLPDNK